MRIVSRMNGKTMRILKEVLDILAGKGMLWKEVRKSNKKKLKRRIR